MYLVKVFDRRTGKQLDNASFSYGSWQEIGLWLDNYGYNDPQFRLAIYFTER